jgi:predicted nucleotide-binding protein (sugar kinase/HSP70/actin superfamily)
MQLFHGTTFELAGDANVKAIFIPLLRSLPRVAEGDAGELCPIALGSPDVVGGVLDSNAPRVVRPVIDFDEAGYQGERFEKSMRAFAYDLGRSERFEAALARAVRAQEDFERALEQLGREALSYCSAQGIVPVVVHGRPYTIHNDVLNSNVPRLLRALGAIAIPLDCFPLEQQKASLPHQYWSYTQRNLQAAISVRRTPGVYSVFCSNYACGPDSFTLHFFAYVMKNKPFAVIETDGHAGDAGTKTRLEAFLHCVDSDLRTRASEQSARTDFAALDDKSVDWPETKRRRARVLLPRMSENARVAAAALASEGFRAEALPPTTREDVRLGRQHTSGKECVPMMLTLGTLLRRLGELPEDESVTFFMPTTRGPCRFGVYHSLHKIVLERLGYADRVDIVSPDDTDYYRGMRRDFSVRLWLGFVAHDLLEAMLYDVRPIERTPGAAKALYTRYLNELVALLERPSQGNWASALVELATGMWGIRPLLQRAAREFGAQKVPGREVPRVSVVGEIYVRLDPFANDFVVDKLEERGIGVRFAPFTEWLEYTTFLGEERLRKGKPWPGDSAVGTRVTGVLQRTTLDSLYGIAARSLGWPKRMTVRDTVEASRPYVDEELDGEAALTLGGPLHERHAGLVHGVVMVGPHECMPCKIAEAQFGKVTEDEPLPVLSLALTGDPVDPDLLDRFAFDVRAEFARQQGRARVSVPPRSGRFSRVLERVTGPASGPASGALRVPPRSSEGSQQRRSLPMFDDREDASAAGE